MKNILVQSTSAVTQPGEGSLVGHCSLCSPGAAADRQLVLLAEILNVGENQNGLKPTLQGNVNITSYQKTKYDVCDIRTFPRYAA